MLGGQSGAQHVVGGCHDLHAQTGDVGVNASRRHEQRFTGLQGDGVEQERGSDAGIPGEGARHLHDVGVHPKRRGRAGLEPGCDLSDEGVDLLRTRTRGG